MVDESVIFQRTKLGRDEIKLKLAGLTQSERRVLIMLDGVTSYSVLPHKTAGLNSERLERALHKLLGLGLVAEVLMPSPNQRPEILDTAMLDRFLQSDPMDPTTIMNLDPEEEYGSLDTMNNLAPVTTRPDVKSVDLNSWALHSSSLNLSADRPTVSPVGVNMPQVHASPRVSQLALPVPDDGPDFSRPQTTLSEYSWEYLLIGLGIALIVLPLIISRPN